MGNQNLLGANFLGTNFGVLPNIFGVKFYGQVLGSIIEGNVLFISFFYILFFVMLLIRNGVIFMNKLNDSNNSIDYLSLLDFSFDESIEVIKTECIDSNKYIHLTKKLVPTYCPCCNSRMHSKGIYKRTVNHPILQDSTRLFIIVHQRRWLCPCCGLTKNDDFSFLEPGKQSTNMTILFILNALKDLNRTTRSVARDFGLSDTQVHDIFTAYVDLPRLPLPEYISIDEVCLNINSRDKYAFVIIDFVTGEPVDLVQNRRMDTLEQYFRSIPLDERKNVKGIISDAYKNYLDKIPDYFPNAVSILDSFHVTKVIIGYLNDYIRQLTKKFKQRDERTWEERAKELNREKIKGQYSQEVILLQKYKWVLLKNYDDIQHDLYHHYHKDLKMHLTTHQVEDMFFKIDPRLKKLHFLKEEYIKFNHSKFDSKEEATAALENLINLYDQSDDPIFIDFSSYLKEHQSEIIRSFTTLQVRRKTIKDSEAYYARLSNGLMESMNRKPKDYIRQTRGSSNFNYTRNRFLWATRKNPAIRAIPKSYEEIHSYTLPKRTAKKRSKHYNKNKK